MPAPSEFRQFELWDAEKKERALTYLLTEVDPDVVRAARRKRTERVPIQDYIEEALEIRKHQGEVQGISTGWAELDALTLGMTAGELIVVSGPTATGKTQLTAHIAYNAALAGHKVLFVTMEMTKPQMTNRFMAASGTDLSELPLAQIEYQKEHDLASTDIEFMIKDATEAGTELVIIDHLHYFSGEDDTNQAQTIGRIAKDFKMAAVAYNVPVLLICHTRKLSKENAKPTGNDLRDSSLIGQHADQIIMIWRDNTPNANSAEVEITNWKNRLRGLYPGKRLRTFYAVDNQLTPNKPYVPAGGSNQVSFYEKEGPVFGAEEIPSFGAEATEDQSDDVGPDPRP